MEVHARPPENYVVQAPFWTQSYNRYSYVLNNPLMYTDPSGELADGGDGSGNSDPLGTHLKKNFVEEIFDTISSFFSSDDSEDRSESDGKYGGPFSASFLSAINLLNTPESTITSENSSTIPETTSIAKVHSQSLQQSQPTSQLDVSQKGLEFIGEAEGFRCSTYLCQAGKPTIGFGHLIQKGEDFSNGITKSEALMLLRNDAFIAEQGVKNYIKTPLSQNQFDALVSLTFNIGVGFFQESTVARVINNGDLDSVKYGFLLFRKVTINGELIDSDGLIFRRTQEIQLFNDGDYNYRK
jgi:lysozyme